jgi:hypothetical protein
VLVSADPVVSAMREAVSANVPFIVRDLVQHADADLLELIGTDVNGVAKSVAQRMRAHRLDDSRNASGLRNGSRSGEG